ncbi:30S ribosomal protein S6--L-glutamate ligase [Rubritalea sp.]|uniref:30S ribosomal protein S6--L-glutamate ligase n=1 Tax=Rubritalea sp. TaxID=2109375 RepID=UPI003EF72E16
MNEQKIIVGCAEWLSLPSLHVPAIKARVDSGAKTSSLHAFNIQGFKRNGESWVHFEVHPIQKNRKTTIRCEAKVADRRIVKSSNGEREKRHVILTTMELAGKTSTIEVTLTNRDNMGYRMLLGREAMQGRILVDPSEELCHGELSKDDITNLYGVPEKKSEGLNIGILASNPDLYSNQRIMEAGEERGHNMHFLNIKHCYLKMEAEHPEVLSRGGHSLNMLDAVIPRIRPSITFYGCALTRHFESIGKFALNTSDSISQSRDKLFSMQLMLKHGLDIPTSGFAHSPMDTNDLIDMVGGAPLIVKLLEGTQGRGVVLAETKKAAESVINAFKALNANLLVQEFVKEAQGKDLRCFVIDGKIVASIERTAAAGEFRANIHQGGQASIVKISPEERTLAIKAAKAFGLQVAGVDIIRSRKGPLLLEVNSSPGLEGIETATGKDIAGLMICAIEKKLGWKPQPKEESPE